jgi:hypothetical protein
MSGLSIRQGELMPNTPCGASMEATANEEIADHTLEASMEYDGQELGAFIGGEKIRMERKALCTVRVRWKWRKASRSSERPTNADRSRFNLNPASWA